MKMIDTVIFYLGIGFFMIAIYEAIVVGVLDSYYWFMVSVGLMLFYTYRRRSQDEKGSRKENKKTKSRR